MKEKQSIDREEKDIKSLKEIKQIADENNLDGTEAFVLTLIKLVAAENKEDPVRNAVISIINDKTLSIEDKMNEIVRVLEKYGFKYWNY